MFGSYIGLALGVVAAYFVFATLSVLCEFLLSCKTSILILPIITVIIGFLVGWAVHYIARLAKK